MFFLYKLVAHSVTFTFTQFNKIIKQVFVLLAWLTSLEEKVPVKKKLKCKFSFYSDFILQQKLCKAFRGHFPHIRAIFKTLCMASATKYSFKNINN